MAVSTYTSSGAKASTAAKLDKDVFSVDIKNHELMRQAYETYLANGRENLAKTLRRGEVRGGGKKPWKQKGTGRARFGSIRVPIWRGGGITFGPLGEENYSKKMTKKAKQTAIRQALTMKAASGAIIVIDDFKVDGKTSTADKLLKKIGASRRILVAVDSKTPEQEKSVRNLQDVTVVQANYLNVYSVMNADSIVVTKKALETLSSWLGSKEGAK